MRDHRWDATSKTPYDAPWTLDEALVFVRTLLPLVLAEGFHIALTGSVLIAGKSEHDLDLVLYPMRSDQADYVAVKDVLRKHGMKLLVDSDTIQRVWRRKGSNDEKYLEVWKTREGKRVDVFFLR